MAHWCWGFGRVRCASVLLLVFHRRERSDTVESLLDHEGKLHRKTEREIRYNSEHFIVDLMDTEIEL